MPSVVLTAGLVPTTGKAAIQRESHHPYGVLPCIRRAAAGYKAERCASRLLQGDDTATKATALARTGM